MPGEVLQATDEFLPAPEGPWQVTSAPGATVLACDRFLYRRKKVTPALQIGEVKAENYVTPVLHKREVFPGSELWALIHDGKVCQSAKTYDALEAGLKSQNGKDIAWHLANGFRVARVRQSFTIEQELKAGGAK